MGGDLERLRDGLENRVEFLEDLVVPEPQDLEAVLFEPAAPALVVGLLLGVLATVELDDQLLLQAGEVDEEGAEHLLAPELVSENLSAAQPRPQQLFCGGQVRPELLGVLLS